MARNNFTKDVVQRVAAFAGHTCSNPACTNPTTSAPEVGENPVRIGVAAHIRAASPGGPRYDPSQTEGERKSIDNALHLCQNCAKVIDSNGGLDYSVETLRSWKKQREAMTRGSIAEVRPPTIFLEEIQGFSAVAPERKYRRRPTVLTHREYSLQCENPNALGLEDVQIRLEFPRTIVEVFGIKAPKSANFTAGPAPDDHLLVAPDSSGVEVVGYSEASYTYLFEAGKLGPTQTVRCHFLCSGLAEDRRRLKFGESEVGGMMAGPGGGPDDLQRLNRGTLLAKFTAVLRGTSAQRQYRVPFVIGALSNRPLILAEVAATEPFQSRRDIAVV
jgi:hypothetical protein